MYDSTTPAAIPTTATLALAYVDGDYQTYDWLAQNRPQTELISTTTTFTGHVGARVYDCERGDGNATAAAYWAERELLAKRRPTIYCSRVGEPGYGWPWVKQELQANGISLLSVDFGIADYTNTPHLVPGSAFTQYANPPGSGGNYDISITNGIWPNTPNPAMLNKPACAIVATPDSKGYYVVAQDGGVFAFGSAPFKDSLPGLGVVPAEPIVDMALCTSGTTVEGYWMVGADGGVFSLPPGQIPFYGSAKAYIK